MCERIPHCLWAVLLTAAFTAALPALAGDAGHLVGLVTDEEGNAIPGARLTLTGPGTAGIRTVTTDARGRYRVIALDAVRPVNILAEADGKVAVVYREYRVKPDRVNRLDVKLRSRGTQDVLVLLDARVPYHQMALDGARSALPRRVRTMEVTEATPSLRRELLRALEESPSAVLAIGEVAARLARSFVRDVPVVHCMVPDPHPAEMAAANTCGVSLVGDLDRMAERLRRLDTRIQRIGTIYDPSRLSASVARFRQATEATGMTLVAGHAHKPEDFPGALDDLARESLDAFVVFMDPEIYTAGNFARVQELAEERDLVLVVPDASMAGAAKAFVLGPSFRESGVVAGHLVKEIVEGRLEPADVGLLEPTEAEVAAATAAAVTAVNRGPAPGGEPPLMGAVAAVKRDPSPNR
jgi:ABC-type uncharacterized transport system substrate-binding protein